jgi:multiple sugar transport system permease protein
MNWSRRSRRWAWAFILPSATFLLAFTILPILAAAVLSLYQWDLPSAPRFVGLANFTELAGDQPFRAALLHTLTFIGGYVPLVMATGLGLALILNTRTRLVGAARILLFLPVVSAWVAVALIWRWMLNARFGVVNWLLGVVGIEGPAWLFERGWAMVAIIGASVWKDTGFVMLLFLAGLQPIPADYLEAARVDGAGRLQAFWRITLPLLTPTTFLVLVILLINSFQIFEQVWILTEGGPAGSTTVVVERIVRNAFEYGRVGYAAAMSWVLFAVIFIVTVVQTRLQKRWVFHEG